MRKKFYGRRGGGEQEREYWKFKVIYLCILMFGTRGKSMAEDNRLLDNIRVVKEVGLELCFFFYFFIRNAKMVEIV